MRNVLITGGSGQLGRAIVTASKGGTDIYHTPTRDVVDICDKKSIEQYITEHNIDIVINCAAYTDVEGAEREPMEAIRINGDGVAIITDVCRAHDIHLIHISTDYVFGGDALRTTPYLTDEPTAPINSYGRSKVVGEEAALKYKRSIIIRTSWLYAPWSKNFCRTILRLATEQPSLRVVSDQRGTPTSALTLAHFITTSITNGLIERMSGIYHFTDGGECTWYDFAQEIVRLISADCIVEPCSTSERKTLAMRPAYSVLDKSRTLQIAPMAIKPWQEALAECMEQIIQEV